MVCCLHRYQRLYLLRQYQVLIQQKAKKLKPIESESRVIVLVTDGKNTAGILSPEEGVSIAKQLNIRIHTIGIGSPNPRSIAQNSFFGFAMSPSQLVLDEDTLRYIAEETGGTYFNAKDFESLQTVYEQIDKLEEREVEVRQFSFYQEKYWYFALFSLLLLATFDILRLSIFKVFP